MNIFGKFYIQCRPHFTLNLMQSTFIHFDLLKIVLIYYLLLLLIYNIILQYALILFKIDLHNLISSTSAEARDIHALKHSDENEADTDLGMKQVDYCSLECCCCCFIY